MMSEKIDKLNEEKKKIIEDMQKMKTRKLEIEEEIKKKKSTKKEKSKAINHTNRLIRVSCDFDDKIEGINNEREENGLERLSKPKITELIIRHHNWNLMEQDMLHFNTNIERGEINV